MCSHCKGIEDDFTFNISFGIRSPFLLFINLGFVGGL